VRESIIYQTEHQLAVNEGKEIGQDVGETLVQLLRDGKRVLEEEGHLPHQRDQQRFQILHKPWLEPFCVGGQGRLPLMRFLEVLNGATVHKQKVAKTILIPRGRKKKKKKEVVPLDQQLKEEPRELLQVSR